jgi:hypothetical protein
MIPPLPASVPVAKTSALAIWSLVLGILSITCLWLLGSIPAIILGILAVKNIDQSGGALKGRGIGVAGIVTGSVGILAGLFSVGMVAAIAVPSFTGVQMKAKQAYEMSQVRQIVLACRFHASEHEGAFPDSLTALLEDGNVDAGVLEPKDMPGGAFLYRRGLRDDSPAGEVFIASPAPVRQQRVVGQVDGLVRLVPEEDFHADYAHLFPHQ